MWRPIDQKELMHLQRWQVSGEISWWDLEISWYLDIFGLLNPGPQNVWPPWKILKDCLLLLSFWILNFSTEWYPYSTRILALHSPYHWGFPSFLEGIAFSHQPEDFFKVKSAFSLGFPVFPGKRTKGLTSSPSIKLLIGWLVNQIRLRHEDLLFPPRVATRTAQVG